MSDDPVRRQYEAFPYPRREPAAETRRLVTGSPSHILEVLHYVFGGRRRPREPLRVLVAGGGTGDATIMLAQQLSDAAIAADILYVDLSLSSRRIAEARAAVRDLRTIRFETMALEDVATAGFEPFDYIDCCGVLHHLADPGRGLEALTSVLADAGGIGLMLYGELGRVGVYAIQDMMRALADGDDDPHERLDLLRRLLKQLPVTNWLRRNPFVKDWLEAGDAGLVDLFLHPRDRAYRVAEIASLVAAAGLRLQAFIEPAFYDPASYLQDGRLLSRLGALSWIDRCAFAERLAGNLRKHICYVVKAGNPVRPLAADEPTAVPVLRDADAAALSRAIGPGGSLTANVDGHVFRKPMPALAGAIIARVDGRRSLGAIFEDMRTIDPALTWTKFDADTRVVVDGLNGLGKLYLLDAPLAP
jgi:SAM-dependent methyltransferase